jgi:hypothetical protein
MSFHCPLSLSETVKPGMVVQDYKIPALKRLRQEDGKFQDSLDYISVSRTAWATE